MVLGQLAQLWRYPVKSMGGESLNSGSIGKNGLAGDRCWAIVDNETQEIRHAKRWPQLLNYQATLQAKDTLVASGFDEDVPDVLIHCPTGDILSGRAANIGQQLSAQLDKPVSLAALVSPDNKDHYRLAKARTPESMAEELQLLEGEAFPDISSIPENLMATLTEYVTPPGTYVDAFPLHLVTTNSLRFLSERGALDARVERYRPNLLIEPTTKLAELTENTWLSYRVGLGDAILQIHNRTVRCSMPSREQQWSNIPSEKGMIDAMVTHCERHLGVYLTVEQSGNVSVGDVLTLL